MNAEAGARLYVDTSVYLAVLLGERGHARVVREMAGTRLLSSTLLVLESTRCLVRLSRDGHLSAAELKRLLDRVEADMELFALRDLTLDLCTGVDFPVVSTPRALDLAHLRTALWFHRREPIARFVTLDEPQHLAARELGLPV